MIKKPPQTPIKSHRPLNHGYGLFSVGNRGSLVFLGLYDTQENAINSMQGEDKMILPIVCMQ